MTSMRLNRQDVEKLLAELDHFDVKYFELIQTADSGIGYTLDIEYSHHLEDRLVTVRVPIVGADTW